jgi:hypothetical protein
MSQEKAGPALRGAGFFAYSSTRAAERSMMGFLLFLNPGYVNRVGAFFAGFDVELHPVAFLNFVDEAGLVDENFFLVIVGDDEAEAFGVVVKLNGAGEHERVEGVKWM